MKPDPEKTVPCDICGRPTPFTGTKRCNLCWSVESHLAEYLESPKAQAVVRELLPKLDDWRESRPDASNQRPLVAVASRNWVMRGLVCYSLSILARAFWPTGPFLAPAAAAAIAERRRWIAATKLPSHDLQTTGIQTGFPFQGDSATRLEWPRPAGTPSG
jgi:hypothetical protein